MVIKLYEEKKKTLGHSIVSLPIHCSWSLCNIDLNMIFLDCVAMCKCKLFTAHKPFKPFVLYVLPNLLAFN